MESLLQDLRFGFRTLIKNPGFSAVAILTLALGTGANSAIFSAVNGVLIRPLPFRDPDRLVVIWGKSPTSDRFPISVPEFGDYREQNQVFDQMSCFAYADFNLTMGDEPDHLSGAMVSANYFSMLGVSFTRGRGFQPEEDQPGASRVAIVSEGLWKGRFGSDPNLLGSQILLDNASFTVVGIAPGNFESPTPEDKPQLWLPISFDGGDQLRVPSGASPETIGNRRTRFLICAARLKPGAAPSQAQADLETIAGRLQQQYKDTNAGISVNVIPLRAYIIGKLELGLIILFVSVLCVLLIACANVANLLLARAAARQREIAIRSALGAGRLRMIRQLLTESVLLSVVGGALGLLAAYGGIKLLVALNPPNIPRLSEIKVDSLVFGVTVAIAILTGLIFGLAPALEASKPDLNETLKEGSRGSTGGRGSQLVRNSLVVSEVALTVFLLIAAGLMLKSFYSLQKVSPGFEPDHTLTMIVNLPASKYTEDNQIKSFYEQVLNGIGTLPGVQSYAAVTSLPLTTNTVFERLRFLVEGQPPANPSEVPRAHMRRISYNYFSTMRIPLLQGRFFTERDRDDSPPVVIVNLTMANRYWRGENPIGKKLTIPSMGTSAREVVGVVADVKHSSLDTESGLEIYVPYLQRPMSIMALVVHTTSDPLLAAASVRGAVWSVDRNQSVYEIKSMEQVVGDSVSQPRLYAVLLGVFASLAVILAAVGIYGVINYSVTQRTHEIGIRIAVGAQPGDILKMIVGQGMLLTLLGLAVGVLVAFIFTRAMESLLFGVSARDLWTFVGIPLVIAIVAFLSSYIPARRATQVDPIIALRQE